jgi:hypothetical protein
LLAWRERETQALKAFLAVENPVEHHFRFRESRIVGTLAFRGNCAASDWHWLCNPSAVRNSVIDGVKGPFAR